jgi:3,4-dihydroxy 2-butanone 4-phosphate synthase/GTP cyclohydrolase II
MTQHFHPARDTAFSTIGDIMDDARNGRMFILVDNEEESRSGDLVLPAQMATPGAIDFMTTQGGGAICLALGQERVTQLGLNLQSPDNRSRHETAISISISARGGKKAADLARTIAVAIDASRGAEHIETPGQVFPLVARTGGVLVRAGHIEAAVDISRLAGLNPSGVICEIRRDDGAAAGLEAIVAFARLHGLRIGTVADLIAYRRRHDHDVERVAETEFESRWGGDWTAIAFRNKAVDAETLALVKGRIDPARPTLVRMHTLGLFDDVLGLEGPRAGLLERSMAAIASEGAGVVVLLNGRDALVEAARTADDGIIGSNELRDYGMGAQILAELGIHDMVLLSNSRHTVIALDGYGLNIVDQRIF